MRKTAAVIGIGFLSTVWLTGCVSDEMIIQANWKMQLPDGGKELYHADTGASFHGDGEKYTVLQYENTEDISKFLNWRADDGTGTLYTNSYSEFAENCLNIIDVPQKERPDYEECVYSYRERETDSSELLLAYDKEKEQLLWSSIFVTLMANKIGGLQFGIYRNCQISSRVFHTAVAALPLTKANRSDFE